MQTTERAVDELLQRFEAHDIEASEQECILRKLFQIIRERINFMLDDETNQKLILKIVDMVLHTCCNTHELVHSEFCQYFVIYLYHKLESFLEVAKTGKHSADSLLWKIFALLGMFTFVNNNKKTNTCQMYDRFV